MAVNKKITECTELAEGPALADLLAVVDISDTTDAASGTTKKNKSQYALGLQVNPQTGTTYTYITTDFRRLVTHSNGSAIAGTLPQAGASFPAGWFMVVQNRGAGALTITPTTSTIDGAATLILNQNEGAIVASDGTNYFTLRGKQAGGGSPGAHGSTHGNGGADEINVAGLSGVLADPQVPITENVQDIVGAMVVAGTNVTVTYNDGAGTLTIDSTGGGSIAPLVIEDANTVAQRNGTTGQTHNIYSSFTDASNYSRMRLAYNSGATTFEIISEALGSGALSTLRLGVGGTNRITIGSGTVSPTHNAYDLGGASNRWSIVYATNVLAATSLQVNGCKLQQTGGNGVWTLTDTSNEPGTWSGLASSPAEFTANQNNYAMPHFAHQQRWSSDASRDVTGISKSQIADQKHLIINVGANDIVLKHESASSTAGNRFLCSTGADIPLSPNQAAEINYDATTQRWRVFKKN